MKYVAIINGQQYEVDIDEDGKVLINGEPRDVDFLNLGGSLFSVITENKSLEAVIDDDEGRIAVMMGGRLFETQVLDERAMLMMQRRGGQITGSGEVHAPMPGLVVEVAAQPEEFVEQGQTLIILESMKMQNELKSPIAGLIHSVQVAAGEAVEKNALLVEIRPLATDE